MAKSLSVDHVFFTRARVCVYVKYPPNRFSRYGSGYTHGTAAAAMTAVGAAEGAPPPRTLVSVELLLLLQEAPCRTDGHTRQTRTHTQLALPINLMTTKAKINSFRGLSLFLSLSLSPSLLSPSS